MTEETRADQRLPSPPAPSVSFFLINLGRQARERVEARLQEHGLTYRYVSALGHLRRQPGLSYSELARRAGVTTQSMQSTVAHLEARGLVQRGPATSQGRRADLQVTRQGAEAIVTAEAAVRAVDDELLEDLTRNQRDGLERALLAMFRSLAGPG